MLRTADGELSATSMLERYGFTGDRLTARVGDLSGGERRRLQLLLELLGEPNVLLLDEPTNDLDIETLTVLEDHLDTWPGTLVLVSHDRYVLERVCDVVYALDGRGWPADAGARRRGVPRAARGRAAAEVRPVGPGRGRTPRPERRPDATLRRDARKRSAGSTGSCNGWRSGRRARGPDGRAGGVAADHEALVALRPSCARSPPSGTGWRTTGCTRPSRAAPERRPLPRSSASRRRTAW